MLYKTITDNNILYTNFINKTNYKRWFIIKALRVNSLTILVTVEGLRGANYTVKCHSVLVMEIMQNKTVLAFFRSVSLLKSCEMRLGVE